MVGLFTAAKLVGAVLFAILAWFTSEEIKPLFPEGFDPGRFSEVNALVGLGVGWVVVGSRAGRGLASGISAGLTGVVALVFWGLLVNCTYEMLRLSLRKQYDGPVEAVVGVFQLMMENLLLMINPTVIGMLIVGGMIAGLLVELTGRSFR